MAVFQTKLDLIPECGTGNDHFIVGSLPDVLDRIGAMQGRHREHAEERARDSWAGGLGFQGSINKARSGDLAGVAKSDALLTKYENLAPATRRTKTVASVAGGCPNVGAYLAGSPVAMRRRQQMIGNVGPLAIIVDTTCSAGISHDALIKRGTAILALVRLLSLARPVTLHVGCSMAGGDSRKNALHIYAQLDTAPLDIARAAHVLSSPSFNRGLLYPMAGDVTGSHSLYCTWPYGHLPDLMRERGHKILGRVIQGEEFLFVPPAYLTDDRVITQPEEWLLGMLKRYGASDDMNEAADAA